MSPPALVSQALPLHLSKKSHLERLTKTKLPLHLSKNFHPGRVPNIAERRGVLKQQVRGENSVEEDENYQRVKVKEICESI